MVTPEELAAIVERLRSQGTDDATVEVKACGKELSKDVWESVSAFANTSGGLFILGLDERKGFTPAEGFNLDRVRDQFVAGIGDGGQPSKLAHPPRYEMKRETVDGSLVLLIEINELDIREKPCYIVSRGIQAGSYKRVDDEDIRLSPSELYEMQSILLPSEADGEVVAEATVDDLDEDLVSAAIEGRQRQSPRVLKGATTRAQQMARVNIASKEGGVRLAGLLAAGVYPQQFFPKLVVDVAVHAGVRKSEPGLPRFLDRQQCDGPLSVCIEDALRVIGRNLRKLSYVSGAARRDEWEVPEEVLREALVNAVLHREYSRMFRGEAVSVDIYPDRIEVTNPGGLWGGKTIETLDDGESRCRNAKLMSLLSAIPIEHSNGYIAESQGSGVKSMINEMETRSLGRPQFIVKPDSFKVILARHGVEIESGRAWISSRSTRDLSRREETMLMLLREAGAPRAVRELRDHLAWDSDDIREICKRLCDEGLVLQTSPDHFELASGDGEVISEAPEAEDLSKAIVRILMDSGEMSARDLADRLGVSIARIRYMLPRLIDRGAVQATAGPHSRNRTYIIGHDRRSS